MENTLDQDPRHKNLMFDGATVADYVRDYHSALGEALAGVDAKALEQALAAMISTQLTGGTVFAAGNGGSAAIAEHLGCDWMKGTRGKDGATLRVASLIGNAALFSAVANDFGYDKVFSLQLEMQAVRGDLLVLVSSSGNSANIVQAAESAKRLGVKIIGMTGFGGGKLAELADISLHVAVNNYGVVEDAHQLLMHALAQSMVKRI